MAIRVGDRLPQVETLTQLVDGRKAPISIDEVFKGKRVVLLAVPGAFTPTCSAKHLPGFVRLADQIRAKGVDEIVCTAVNDAYVLEAWKKEQGADAIRMLADGNGDFAAALGLDKDGRAGGMGVRSQRYAMVVDDGVVKVLNVEESGEFAASRAETILELL